MYSLDFKADNIIEFNLSDSYDVSSNWTKYATGILSELAKVGHHPEVGFDMMISGNIPNGAGLSSSASLELVVATAMNNLYNFYLSKVDLVKLSQKAENDFVGMKCGIMDQFIIGMGKENHGLLLNTATLEYHHAKMDLEDYAILIVNTNKQRGLADSKYNERRHECQEALKIIQKSLNVKALGDLSIEEFDQVKDSIDNHVFYQRAKHIVSENQRVKLGADYLKNGELSKFGELMNQSHDSLRDDYDVSCEALDVLVEITRNSEGVLGSRMTGAGFGGCTVTIIKKDCIESFIESVGKLYNEKIGLVADFYNVEIGDGARELI